MARLVLLSDTHGMHRELSVPDGDILVHAGDLTEHGTLEEVRAFDAWLGGLPHPVKIVITNQRFMPFGAPREVGEILEDYTDDGYTDLNFTGQRAYLGQSGSAGFGLMDFNARFYDPYLYRRTQPDTIIPDLTNPQSLNRYSYTLNSPILYVDPSGYTPCIDGDCEVQDRIINHGPTLLDWDLINDIPFRYHKDGTPVHTEKEVYQDYLEVWWDFDSWVWEEYGSDGEYTLEEHLSMLLLGETANIWHEVNGLFESEVREYYEYSEYFGLDPTSIYSLLSFVVREYESIDLAVGNSEYQYDTWAAKPENITSTQTLVNLFRNPLPAWTKGYSWADPYWSGNQSMLTTKERNVLTSNYVYVYYYRDTFIVMSGCVWLLHENGDLTNSTITSCPVIGGN